MKHSAKVKQQRAYGPGSGKVYGIPAQDIIDCVECNFDTGELVWKNRPLKHCKSERERKRWNTLFAGKTAFGTLMSDGYRAGRIFDCAVHAHRVVWLLANGDWPVGQIDHINGDKSDNRLSNLREVTASENKKNIKLPSDNKSGVIGVCRKSNSSRWQAYISIKGKQVRLGFFATKEEAIAARKAAEIQYGYHPNHGRAA